MAQSDKDKSNLTSAVPCVCILHNSWPLVAHTSFRHLWPKLPLAYVHVCVCVCVCVFQDYGQWWWHKNKHKQNENHSG